jgi:hypothetical protein
VVGVEDDSCVEMLQLVVGFNLRSSYSVSFASFDRLLALWASHANNHFNMSIFIYAFSYYYIKRIIILCLKAYTYSLETVNVLLQNIELTVIECLVNGLHLQLCNLKAYFGSDRHLFGSRIFLIIAFLWVSSM